MTNPILNDHLNMVKSVMGEDPRDERICVKCKTRKVRSHQGTTWFDVCFKCYEKDVKSRLANRK